MFKLALILWDVYRIVMMAGWLVYLVLQIVLPFLVAFPSAENSRNRALICQVMSLLFHSYYELW